MKEANHTPGPWNVIFHGSDNLLFYWHGKNDGAARVIPHVRRFSRNGVEYASLAALLRAIEESHKIAV